MKKTTRYILAVAGVIAAAVGIMLSVPAFLGNQIGGGIAAVFLAVLGLVLLAISFGEGK